jgi:PAS domain S-box-containing protein
MAPSVRPTGVERSFAADEIVVTKTDLQGRITYANDVFLRVGAYAEQDVLGQPHNLIRHPDMPRSVFALMWQAIQNREELFAYVVNLAADGAHYWVFAHVTPSIDEAGRVNGYHSNRRLPNRDAVAAIKPVYQALLAEESRHGSAVAASKAGLGSLERMLAERGTTYDEFVWSITADRAA